MPTVLDLRGECKRLGIKRYSRLNKYSLVEVLAKYKADNNINDDQQPFIYEECKNNRSISGGNARKNGNIYEIIIYIIFKTIVKLTEIVGDITSETKIKLKSNTELDIKNNNHTYTLEHECLTGIFNKEVNKIDNLKLDKLPIIKLKDYKNILEIIIKKNIILGDITPNTDVKLLSNKKVGSIHDKKTTTKTDLIINDHSISIKMSNKGTQWQIIPLGNFIIYCKKNNIEIENFLINIFKKFLGISKPSNEDLTRLNNNRNKRNKDKKRWWLTEMSYMEKKCIEGFIVKYKKELIQFCLVNGMCKNNINKPEIFLCSNNSFTKTGIIDFSIYSYKEIYNKISEGDPCITKQGNLELSKYIGVQRKGSGSETSRNCIQFKDRGMK